MHVKSAAYASFSALLLILSTKAARETFNLVWLWRKWFISFSLRRKKIFFSLRIVSWHFEIGNSIVENVLIFYFFFMKNNTPLIKHSS